MNEEIKWRLICVWPKHDANQKASEIPLVFNVAAAICFRERKEIKYCILIFLLWYKWITSQVKLYQQPTVCLRSEKWFCCVFQKPGSGSKLDFKLFMKLQNSVYAKLFTLKFKYYASNTKTQRQSKNRNNKYSKILKMFWVLKVVFIAIFLRKVRSAWNYLFWYTKNTPKYTPTIHCG